MTWPFSPTPFLTSTPPYISSALSPLSPAWVSTKTNQQPYLLPPPSHWPRIRSELLASPWPDLPLSESGTHLGVLIGRDVTLENIWSVPLNKASTKISSCLPLLRSLPLSSRILYINVFIVSLFSYISLFFILPTDLWKPFTNLVRKIFPFNGGAFSYSSLVCANKIFSVKPGLKDVWAFNVSLLAVRSPLFTSLSTNYNDLPSINLKYNLFIKDHRDAAAVDFWRSRHLPDGTLVPPSPPTSSEVYKILVNDVYLEEAVNHCSKKIHGLSSPPPSTLFLSSTLSRAPDCQPPSRGGARK